MAKDKEKQSSGGCEAGRDACNKEGSRGGPAESELEQNLRGEGVHHAGV